MPKPIEYYTGLTTFQIIEEFERELAQSHHGSFYEWVDSKYDLEFTKLGDELNSACDIFMNSEKTYHDDCKLRAVRAKYFKTLIDRCEEYRKEKGLDETKHFINSFLK